MRNVDVWLPVLVAIVATPDPFGVEQDEGDPEAVELGADVEPSADLEADSKPAACSGQITDAKCQQAPRRTECRREDFASFDDFVACQEAQLPPDPPASEVEPVELPPPRLSPRIEQLIEAEGFYLDLTVGTLIPGALLIVGGGIMTGVGFLNVDDVQRTSGPRCVIGKPCGNTCIELADTCHIGSDDVLSKQGKILVGVGLSTLLAGAALTIVGGVGASRLAITRHTLQAALAFTGQSVLVVGRF